MNDKTLKYDYQKKWSNNCFNLSIPFVMKLASGFAWQVSRQSLRAGIAG
jgi:hypothetical protein